MSGFEKTVPKNKSEFVAQRLLDRIITSNLTPGSNFGTEADLLAQFDVSRPTLRESLRILEAQGVLELRPGPKGGIIVRKPGMDVLAHSFSVYLRLHDVPFIEVLKAREVIEPTLAAATALARSDQDLAEMQASVERLAAAGSEAEFIEENRRFHSLVAHASGNEVMLIFWSTISILAAGEQHGITYSPANRRHVVEAHQAIVDAIRDRDARLAETRMRAHIDELEQLIRKRYQYLLTQATTIVARQGRRLDQG